MEQRTFGTHDGSFHADEVTACALLLLFDLIDRDKIRRTRSPDELARCDYVCDVGGIYDPQSRRFDHHQPSYKGPLSSAGMILLYLKDQKLLDPHFYDSFNRALIWGVDAHDNGRAKVELGTASFSHVISNFLPVRYDSTRKEMDEAFFNAVEFVVGYLEKLKARFEYARSCQSIVKRVMANSDHALIFDESMPWLESFFEFGGESHPAEFLIMPTGNHWKLRGVPPSLEDRMKVRRYLPESWAGLREKELQGVTGVEGAIFCHKGRFISIWETKEAAIKALRLALEQKT